MGSCTRKALPIRPREGSVDIVGAVTFSTSFIPIRGKRKKLKMRSQDDLSFRSTKELDSIEC
jgi:hypothetical protein